MTDVGNGGLAQRVRAGDRAAFGEMYAEYSERVFGLCAVVLRNRDEADDATQDVFVLAAQRIAQLRDPERLAPWLCAIARHVCLRRLRQRERMLPSAIAPDVIVLDDNASAGLEAADAADLVWSAAEGMSERDRAVLYLNTCEGLDGDDLTAALGVTHANPYSLVNRAREQLERAVGVLLVARAGRSMCDELDGMLRNWDGKLTPLLRKRLGRHVEQCSTCQRTKSRAKQLSILAAAPFLKPTAAHALNELDTAARHALASEHWKPDGFPPDDEPARTHKRTALLLIAAALMYLLFVGGLATMANAGGAKQQPKPRATPTTAPRQAKTKPAPHATTTTVVRVEAATTVPARPVVTPVTHAPVTAPRPTQPRTTTPPTTHPLATTPPTTASHTTTTFGF